ncbi:MAG: hypothetical protein WD967_02165 [Candidatus Levyibacteriota bacterium]
MAFERFIVKEYVNLSLGLDPFESWEDLVKRGTKMTEWGWFLLGAGDVVDVNSSIGVTEEQRQIRTKEIEDERLKDEELLNEAEAIHIKTGKITPRMLCGVETYYGGKEEVYPLMFGSLVAAAGRSQEEILEFVNDLMVQIDKMDGTSLRPVWGREGFFQNCADFFRTPVVGHFFEAKQEYTPNIRR